MSIPTRLSSYLDQRNARYEICLHTYSRCSAQTARTAHVPPHQLAKSVIVEDDNGCVMAIAPADRNVLLGQLSRLLDRKHLRLANEADIASVFSDCDRGAVPALGMALGRRDGRRQRTRGQRGCVHRVGDHEHLLRLSNDQFHELMLAAQHGHFCGERIH